MFLNQYELETYPLIIERKVRIASYCLKLVHNERGLLVGPTCCIGCVAYSLMYYVAYIRL